MVPLVNCRLLGLEQGQVSSCLPWASSQSAIGVLSPRKSFERLEESLDKGKMQPVAEMLGPCHA